MARSMKYVGLLIICSIAGLCNPYQSVAQQNRQQVRQPVNGQAPIRTKQANEFLGYSLDREVALPNVPGYTGKQIFLSGMQYPNERGGTGYFIVFNTEHTQSQVREWWENALSSDPWKIDYKDSTSIKAHAKDGTKCSVSAGPKQANVDNGKVKGMNGSYTIYFHPATPPAK